jgi:hypothetical protein
MAKQKKESKENIEIKKHEDIHNKFLVLENNVLRNSLNESMRERVDAKQKEEEKKNLKVKAAKRLLFIIITIFLIMISVAGWNSLIAMSDDYQNKISNMPENFTTYNEFGDEIIYQPYMDEELSGLEIIGAIVFMLATWASAICLLAILLGYIFPDAEGWNKKVKDNK